MDHPPSPDNTYAALSIIVTFRFLNLINIPQVWCSLYRHDSWCSVGCVTRFTFACSDFHVFCAGYTEVITKVLGLASPLIRRSRSVMRPDFLLFPALQQEG